MACWWVVYGVWHTASPVYEYEVYLVVVVVSQSFAQSSSGVLHFSLHYSLFSTCVTFNFSFIISKRYDIV